MALSLHGAVLQSEAVCLCVCYTGVHQCTTEAVINFRFIGYIPCIVDASILVIVYITSSLQNPLDAAVIVSEKDNTPFNYPILNSRSLKSFINRSLFRFR